MALLPPKIQNLQTLATGGEGKIFLGRTRPDDRLLVLRPLQAPPYPIPRHPNLARKEPCLRIEGKLFEAEAFLEGQPLADAGRLPPSLLIPIAHQCLRALGTLHQTGLVHGDISPRNIILSSWKGSALPILIDFGLTGPIGSPVRGTGTFGTMAPEVARGSSLTPAMDLFSLGLSLLSAALGEAPNPRWTLEAASIQRALQTAPSELRPILNALCAPNTRLRAGTWTEALKALPPLKESLPTPAEAWPLVGRETLLAEAQRFLEAKGQRVLLLVGEEGLGKRSIGRQLQYWASSKQWKTPQHIALCTDDSPNQLSGLLAALEGGTITKAILCSNNPKLADLFDQGEGQLSLEVPALEEKDLQKLFDLLPLAADLNPSRLLEGTGGIPGALKDKLDPDPLPPQPLPISLFAAFHFGMLRHTEKEGTPLAAQEKEALQRGELVVIPGKGLGFRNPAAPREMRLRCSPQEARSWHEKIIDQLNTKHQPPFLLDLHQAIGRGRGLAKALEHLAREELPKALRFELFEEIARCVDPDLLFKESSKIQSIWEGFGPLDSRNPLRAWIEGQDPKQLPPTLLALWGRIQLDGGDLDRARNILQELPDSPFPGWEESRIALARTLQFQGELQASDEIARALIQQQPAPLFQAEALRILSLNAFRGGKTSEAIDLLHEAMEALGTPQDEREKALQRGLSQNLGVFERKRGKVHRALQLFEETAQKSLLARDLPSACIAWINAGIALEDLGKLRASLEPRSKAFRRASALGLAQARDVALGGIGIALAKLGADGPAVEVLQKATQALQDQGLVREALLARLHCQGARMRLHGILEEEEEKKTSLSQAFGIDSELRNQVLEQKDPEARALLRALEPAPPSVSTIPRLKETASSGLPLPKVEAALTLARISPPQEQRHWIARVLRESRTLDLPGHALIAHSLALGRSHASPGAPSKPYRDRVHAHRIQDLAHQLSTIPSPIPLETPLMMQWNQLLKTLGQTGQNIAQSLRPNHRGFQAKALDRLVQINRLIQQEEGSPEELFRQILEQALQLTGAWRGLILEKGILKKERLLIALSQTEEGGFGKTEFAYSKSILTEVLETGRPKLTFNALEDPDLRQAFSVIQYDLHAIICVPLFSHGQVVGALYLDHPYAEGTFEEDMLPLLEALGTQISLSLENMEHQKNIEKLNTQLKKKVEEQELEIHRTRRGLLSEKEERPVLYRTAQMEELMRDVRRIASSDLPAHIRGETGTGKELIARRLHQLSPRRAGPFVAENCTSLSKELLESELFGHVAGAFTGAHREKKGLFEMANGGTLFLDEIGDMPLALQSKILRVLQEGELRPVGSTQTKSVDVRLISATHRDLEKLVQEGKFREDLFYRIVVADLRIPPLRERREDIPLLAKHFLKQAGSGNHKLPPDTLSLLLEHDWPGNVRELESAIRSALILAENETIRPQDLPARIRKTSNPPSQGELPALKIRDLERLALQEALKQTGGNRLKAARLLGISRSSVFVKIREYGIQG